MKNHTNDCLILGGPESKCSCSFDNQQNRDIVQVLNERAELQRENEHYVDVIEDLTKLNGKLQANFDALAEYPWGLPWTYWFTAMTSGIVAIIGWHVGIWVLT